MHERCGRGPGGLATIDNQYVYSDTTDEAHDVVRPAVVLSEVSRGRRRREALCALDSCGLSRGRWGHYSSVLGWSWDERAKVSAERFQVEWAFRRRRGLMGDRSCDRSKSTDRVAPYDE